MMGSKRRASRDMARMDGKHFSLDSVLTVLSFLIFLPAMRELTTSVLLYGPYTRTLGVAIYSLRSDGYIVDSSALASLAIVLIIICNTVVNAILKDRKKV